MGDGAERRALVLSRDPRADDLADRLTDAGVSTRRARKMEWAAQAAERWRPQALLFDAETIADAGPEAVKALRTGGRCVCALLADEVSGPSANEAVRVGADTIVPWDADAGTMTRLLALELAGRDGRNGAGLPPFVGGTSPRMRAVWRMVFLAAPDDATVLIQGETGAGKEVVARALHRFSSRRDGPFVAVNCAALPAGLLESELFGHERGAFTGAVARREGRFERAQGGTLLLDEVGDLPAALQAKLLRVLQERHFERVGGTEPIEADVRVVAATHRDLADECEVGAFRADLFYRLAVLTIRVPPLRECRDDVLALWEHFVRCGAERRGRTPPELASDARRRLLRHDWPGNVRELQNAAEHALTVSTGDAIDADDLPNLVRRAPEEARPPLLVGMTLDEAERELILQTYRTLRSAAATAEMLGISVRKVQYRLKRFREEGYLVESSEPPPAPEPEPAPAPHVLLAEDDDELRWALEAFLTSGGFRVTSVPDGRRALAELGPHARVGDGDPDVLVTDVRMPGLTGIELLESLRRSGSDVPIIVITAFADDAIRGTAEQLGVDELLPKPIDAERLEAAIRAAVRPSA